jgi:vitamin B12 transporter
MTSLVRGFLAVPTITIFLTTAPAGADEIAGRVLDASQAYVSGARLTLMERATGRQRIATSDTAGLFRFINLSAGAYLLKAEFSGFQTEVIDVFLDNTSRGADELEIVLQIGPVSDEILVTATASPLRSSEAGHASTVVDARTFERRGLPLVGDVLRGLPGVRVQRLGDPGSFTTVRFRGMRDVDTAVLLNGYPIRDVGGLRGDVSSFFQELFLVNLDRVEVVPGASSHLYGSSGSGGVINLVPPAGATQTAIDARVEAGALGLARGALQAQGSAGRLHYGAGAHWLDVARGLDAHDVFRNTTLSGLARVDVSPTVYISGIAHYSNTPRADLNTSPFPIGPSGKELEFERGLGPVAGFVRDLDDPDARRESRLWTAVGSWHHRPTAAWSYSLSYQRTDARRDFPEGPGVSPILGALGVSQIPADLNLVEGTYRAVYMRHDVEIGRYQSVTVGAERTWESRTQRYVSRATNVSTGPTTDRQASAAVYVQDHLWLLDRALNITGSFRGQFFTVENPVGVTELRGLETPDAYTGGLAVAYFLEASGTKIRSQAANGFRAPSLAERFAVFNSSIGPLRVGNPLLRPERTLTIDGGVDQRMFGGHAQVSATYFYNRLQEIITSRRRLFQQANEAGGLSRGVELAAHAVPKAGVQLRGSYTYTRADLIPTADLLRSDNTIARAGVARPFESTPAHEWSFGAVVERLGWNVGAEYARTSKYEEVLFSPRVFRPVLFEFGGLRRLDAVAAYGWRSAHGVIEPYVRAQNILDDEYLEDGFRTPGVAVWAGLHYRFK